MSRASGSGPEGFTRRTFLKATGGSVVLLVTPVHLHTSGATARPAHLREPGAAQAAGGWSGPPGEARYRIEGLAKVTGQKIYARDFRAGDMGWTGPERAALVLRARHADRPFEGVDLSSLTGPLAPVAVVDADTLRRDSISGLFPDRSPPGRPGGMFVKRGDVPVYLGQPLCIVIFRDWRARREAGQLLQFDPDIVRYGAVDPPPPIEAVYDPPTYLTKYAADGEDFSQTKDGYSNPHDPKSPVDEEAKRLRGRIIDELGSAGWRVFQSECTTQTLDPMFMEPETGLGWYDRGSATMNVVLGTQSTNGDFRDATELFKDPQCPIEVETVHLTSCYPGGGFGGRDESPFSPLLMLAAAYSDGPVRMSRDRFEQFQAGLKQPGSRVIQSLAVDAEHRFQALYSILVLEAGGKNNYSQFVAALAGYSAGGGYRLPRAAVDAVAMPSDRVVAGSMRGFGGPQAAFALETLVEEAAAELQADPIALRRLNALQDGDLTITGAPPQPPLRIVEILDRAAAHPLWTEREAEKARRADAGVLYGVGFALANQAYGTNSDGVMAAVELASDGSLTVHTNAVDMGNGSATTLALGTARWLGANATTIDMGAVALFDQLGMTQGKPKDRHHEKVHVAEWDTDEDPWGDPTWTKGFSSSSSACLTAFHQEHVVQQASRVLARTGVWPAACAIWGRDPNEPGAFERATWTDGQLGYPGEPPLPLARIADALWRSRGVSGAMVHGFFSGDWVSADFTVDGTTERWPLDGLALRRAPTDGYGVVVRQNTTPPPADSSLYGRSQYAPSASLIAVEIDPDRITIEVTDVHTILDAGRVLQPDLLSGQYQGGVAMGIGQALIERFPASGGEGDWNLNRYHVALSSDLPLDRITLDLLEAGPDDPAKGIAEAVLCPIAPALANAVFHATGAPVRGLPISFANTRGIE